MSIWFWVGAMVLAGAMVEAQNEMHFAEEEDSQALERALDDQPAAQRLALRWRVRGDAWEGERLQLYQRVAWQGGEGQEFHLVTERDPGERRWADFAAFYAQGRIPGKPLEGVVGDLRPGWGSGLVCGRGGSRGGLPLAHPGRDSERLGYRSSGENQALRGVAVRVRQGGMSGTAIGGWAQRDARLDETGVVTSLPESGYHVTRTEEAGRRLLKMWVGGGRLHYQGRRGGFGASLLVLGFDRQVDLRHPERKPWAFQGEGQGLWGVDGEVDLGRVEVRGEAARDGAGRWGAVAGGRMRWRQARLRVVGRWYDPGFHSFFGGAPSRGGMENEQGLFASVERRGWQVFGDWYRRPERTYYYPRPAILRTWGASARQRLGSRVEGRVLFREDRAPYWRDGRSVAETSQRLRVELGWERGPGLLARLRLRLEGRVLGRVPGEEEQGVSLGMLGSGQWRAVRWWLHGSCFATDSYFTRLYEYEYDLPGAVSIRPLFGRGWWGYALLGIQVGGLEIGGRYRLQRDGRMRHYGGVQVEAHLGP